MLVRLLDRIGPPWLVVGLVGTAVFVITLATVQRPTPVWLWLLYGVGLACWLGFVLLDRRSPQTATALLLACLLVSVTAIGPAPDGTPVLLTCVGLAVTCSLPRLSSRVLAAVLGLTFVIAGGGTLTWAQGATSLFGDLAVLLIMALIGLSSRQHQMQARLLASYAALDERARIAREMHDVLAHSLGALGVQLEVAEALLSERGDLPGGLLRVQRARLLAHEGLDEARRAVAALRADVVALDEALSRLIEDGRRDRGLEVDFVVTGTVRPVPAGATVALLRIAREALTNAAKHAPGSAVSVSLDYGSGVRLRVYNAFVGDTGVPGHGLTGMRERIALVGGTLTAGRSGEGWLVTAEVPE
ncbi:GAF sensor signal transduction histidine kinase [Kutzneria sp. 744]|nr:GAF sensor signal transduction histidine kinase [Kutzneria sp. 744]